MSSSTEPAENMPAEATLQEMADEEEPEPAHEDALIFDTCTATHSPWLQILDADIYSS